MMKKDDGPISEMMREQALDKALLEKAGRCAQDYLDRVLDRPVFPGKRLSRLEEFRHELPEEPGDPGAILDRLHRFGSRRRSPRWEGVTSALSTGVVPASLPQMARRRVGPERRPLRDVPGRVDPRGSLRGVARGPLRPSRRHRRWFRRRLRHGQPLRAGGRARSPFGKEWLGCIIEGAFRRPRGPGGHRRRGALHGLQGPLDPRARQGTSRQGSHRRPGTFRPTAFFGRKDAADTQAGTSVPGPSTLRRDLSQGQEAGAWVHIDGAFGLWAVASPRLRHLTTGMELADSWSVDAHKTLNAPYDSGIVLCRRREALTGALQVSGSYIAPSGHRDGMHYTLDMSRRARAVELWACHLGRRGRRTGRGPSTRPSFRPGPGKGFLHPQQVCFNRCWSLAPRSNNPSPRSGSANAGAAALVTANSG